MNDKREETTISRLQCGTIKTECEIMAGKIRVGVFGAGRGAYLGTTVEPAGMELVAICDLFEPLLAQAKRTLKNSAVTFYTDYGKFLEHDLDAVIVANYATEHAPAAIRALQAGKHVLSECMAVFTPAEAVALVEAVETSGKVYMFAENYPFAAPNLEMRRLYQSGELGEFQYGEGEYIHPIPLSESVGLCSGPSHWRAWLPITYYCTHSMGPVMLITGTRPTQVGGFVVPYDEHDPRRTEQINKMDTASILMCRMDNGGWAKIIPWAFLRDHGNRVRICCSRGSMECNQAEDGLLRVRREPFDFPDAKASTEFYRPRFPAEFASAAGFSHGGGDFFTGYYFAKAIRENSRPIIDVYMALDMTLIGIQGYRSALAGGMPMPIPDFRDQAVRDAYRHDDWNPDPARPCRDKPSASIRGDIAVLPETERHFMDLRRDYEKSLAE